MADDQDAVVQLGDFSDQFEAEVVAARLQAAGIPATAQDATVYGGIELNPGSLVWVRRRDLEEAERILAEPTDV